VKVTAFGTVIVEGLDNSVCRLSLSAAHVLHTKVKTASIYTAKHKLANAGAFIILDLKFVLHLTNTCSW